MMSLLADPSVLQAANSCLLQSGQRCAPLTLQGSRCPLQPPFGCRTLDCLGAVCQGKTSIDCCDHDPKKCRGCITCARAGVCGSGGPGGALGKVFTQCNVTFCMDQLPDCGYLGLGSQGTILHELLHCCGFPDDAGMPYPSCNNVAACCILNVIRNQPTGHCQPGV